MMNKRKALLLLILAVTLTGCGKTATKTGTRTKHSQVKTESTVKAANSSKASAHSTVTNSKKKTKNTKDSVNLKQYDSIVAKYAAVIDNPKAQDLPVINIMSFLVNQDFYVGLYSTQLDVDKNGIPELLIGLKNQDGNITLLDMYTISKQNKLVRLTTKEAGLGDIGERMLIFPLKDGKIQYSGSASAFLRTNALYVFDQGGTHLSKIRTSENQESLGDLADPIDIVHLNWQQIQAPVKKEAQTQQAQQTTGMNFQAVKNGDLSSIQGTWSNNAGSTIEITGSSVKYSSGPNATIDVTRAREESQLLIIGVRTGPTGASMVLAPAGSTLPENQVVGETETNKDRILIKQAPIEAKEVYYRD